MINLKKIIIAILVIGVAFAAYSFLASKKTAGSATGVTKQVVSSSGAASVASSATLDGPGKEFVTQLLAIQNIKFNLALFSDPVFEGLQDWSREILPQETGRSNPFAPLEGDTGGAQASGIGGFTGNIASDSAAVPGASSSSSSQAAGKAPAKAAAASSARATAGSAAR